MNRMFHALRNWFRATPSTRRTPPPKRPSLNVELLEDRVVPATDWRSIIGLDLAQSAQPSNQGTGYSIAILDTGIDYNHADLGGGFGVGKRVVAGWDFVNNDADPMDDHGHGTHLAGIIGSANSNSRGVDPNANLIALKVLNSSNTGTWTAIDSALQWVIANQAKYNIVAVNLSLGSGNYTSNPYAFLENDFTTLKSLGVFTAAAAGNRFYTYNSQPGVGYPSISPNVVAVGATWAGDFGSVTFSSGATDYTTAADRVVSMGQRGANLGIMAPGAWITSTSLGNTYRSMGGTSMATAIVAGAAAVIHEAYDKAGQSELATQDNILNVMRATGVNVLDGDDENDNVVNTGLTFKRLNLKAALDTIGQPNSAPSLAAVADQTMSHAQDKLTLTLAATDTDSDPITFSAQVLSVNGVAPAVTVSLQGSQLTLDPASSYVGTFTVQVNASDGQATVSRTFAVNVVSNSAPTLGSIAAQSMATGVTSLTISLPVADTDNDPLTVQAVAQSPDAPAYQLDQQYGFGQYGNSYFTNLWGYNEKWLVGANNQWYLLLPTGQLYRWSLSITETLKPANYIASLAPAFWTEPRLLWDAKPPVTPALTFSYVGNQLTIQRPANLTGIFFIEVTVSDGLATAKRTMQLTLN